MMHAEQPNEDDESNLIYDIAGHDMTIKQNDM